jgi:quercetin dioxygenase-like cupin family protein
MTRRLSTVLERACALSLGVLVIGSMPLVGQQGAAKKETLSFKTVPVTVDKDYGAAIARIGEGRFGEGRLHQMDATIVEIPPGGTLAPRKLLAEEIIYVIAGKGHTTMWPAGAQGKQQRYDWGPGDVLSPSLNVWRAHANASKTEPARFLSLTSTPLTRNLFNDAAFVMSSDYVFEKRWAKGLTKPQHVVGNWSTGEGDLRRHNRVDKGIIAIGHHFPDMINGKMEPIGEGRTGFNVRPTGDASPGGASMAGNRLFEWQNREELDPRGFDMHYHRHPWEVLYLCIKGEMQSRLTKVADFDTEKLEPERVVTWKEGDLLIVEANEYHTHASSAPGSRFLQFKVSGYFYGVGSSIPLTKEMPHASSSQ